MSEDILRKFCAKYDVMLDDLLSHKRDIRLVRARVAISRYLRLDGYSFTYIAKLLNRHHSSIMYYVNEYEDVYDG